MQNTFCIIYFAFSKHFYSRIVQLKKTTYHSCDFLVAHIYPCESRSVMSDSLRHHDSTRLLCPWESPGKNTGVGSLFLLQGIFPTQEFSPGLPYHRQILYHLSYQGSPKHRLGSKCASVSETERQAWVLPTEIMALVSSWSSRICCAYWSFFNWSIHPLSCCPQTS